MINNYLYLHMFHNFMPILQHISYLLNNIILYIQDKVQDFRNINNFLFFYFLQLNYKNYFVKNNFLYKFCNQFDSYKFYILIFLMDFVNIKNFYSKNSYPYISYINLYLFHILNNFSQYFLFIYI